MLRTYFYKFHLLLEKRMSKHKTILNFTITRFENPSQELKEIISEDASEPCRWVISKQYLKEVLDKTRIGYIVTFPETSFYAPRLNREKIAAFILASYDEDGRGFIYLVCNMQFFSDRLRTITGNGEIPLRFGFLLHCYVLRDFQQLGINEVYLDATDLDRVKYYTFLGYLLGKERCGYDDPITKYHQNNLLNPETFLPDDYKTPAGYRMKLCYNFTALCKISEESLSRALEIIKKYQLDDFYTTA